MNITQALKEARANGLLARPVSWKATCQAFDLSHPNDDLILVDKVSGNEMGAIYKVSDLLGPWEVCPEGVLIREATKFKERLRATKAVAQAKDGTPC